MQKLIVLRGCMASGKSTIAKWFRNFDNKTVWIKVDNFKDFFSPNTDPKTLPFVHGAAIVTLDYLLKEGFSIIMEGVFQNPGYIALAVQTAIKYNVPNHVFQLNVPLAVLQERDMKREGVKEGCRATLSEAEITRIFHVLENNPYTGAIDLDTQKLRLEECVKIIEDAFNN